MKQVQWMAAVVVLAVMVFAVTFALNYVGNTGSGGNTGTKGPDGSENPEALELSFLAKKCPPDEYPEMMLDWELHRPGWHDFWFTNANEKPVRIGLYAVGCSKCSSVEVRLMTEEWKSRRAILAAGQQAARLLPALSGAVVAAACEYDPVLDQQEQAGQLVALEKNKESVKIPPGSVGYVRLRWNEQTDQGVKLAAEIWMNQKGDVNLARLETRVRFHPPLRLPDRERNRKAVVVRPQNLPIPMDVICWSSTRSTLPLKVQLLSLQPAGNQDPFQVGQPVRLSALECAELEKDHNLALNGPDAGRVLSAWRVPVTLRDRAEDGKTLIDAGPFRRRLELRVEGDASEPLSVYLLGQIEGDVLVGNPEDEGRIRFNPFSRSKGARKTITVSSFTPNLKLEVDQARTAPFLEAHLSKPEGSEGGRQLWRLTVEVLPDRVIGQFPRDGDPAFRDSAVYLKQSTSDRGIRIPVGGTANEQ